MAVTGSGNLFYCVLFVVIFAFALPCLNRFMYMKCDGIIFNFRGTEGFPYQDFDGSDTMCGNDSQACYIHQHATLHTLWFMVYLVMDIGFLVSLFVVGGVYVFGDNESTEAGLTSDIYDAYVVNAAISTVAVVSHMCFLFSANKRLTGCFTCDPEYHDDHTSDQPLCLCQICGPEESGMEMTGSAARYKAVDKTFAI